MQTNILEYLEFTARRTPEKTAFSDGTTGMTFRQVHDQARAIGSFLYRAGFYKQPVVVFMKKHPRTITAFLGAVYGGNFYVPLDEEMPLYRLEGIFRQLQPGVVLCDDTTRPLLKKLPYTGAVYHYEEAAFGIIDEPALAEIRQQQLDIDPIYIVFTSGSTGTPKGVIGCHRAVIDYIEQLCGVLRFSRDTVFGNQTPLYFDACLKEIIPTLKYGATIYLIPRKLFLFPVQLVQYLNQYKINTLCWVVSALTCISSLHAFDRIQPRYLRTIAFASEVFPIRQLKLWRSSLPGARFINLYGPTETTGICCYYEVDRPFEDWETLPIGRPFPNTQILLLNEQGQEAAPGEQGEICVRGTRLTLGYFRDAERTGEAFVQNPLNTTYPDLIYKTGDLGKYNSRGELVFLGRRDHQIKHMGHRIELGEIEAAANSREDITSACCLYDSDNGKILLYYTGTAQPKSLSGWLKERLPRYMLPQVLHRLDKMPLTPNGKIDRSTLKTKTER